MSNLATKEVFTPRKNLERTLSYRPHLKLIYYFMLGTVASISVHLIYVAINVIFRGEAINYINLIFDDIVIFFAFLFQAIFLFRPLAFTKIHLHKESLNLERFGQSLEIHFKDVASVKLSFLPYLGGRFTLILNNGKSYRFTVALERSEYILEAVYGFNPQLFSLENMLAYRRTSVISDHSWARVYEAARGWPKLIVKYIHYPILAALFLSVITEFFGGNNASPILELIWNRSVQLGILNLKLGAATWMLGEIYTIVLVRSKFLQDPNFVARHISIEKRVATIVQFVYYGSVTVALLLQIYYAKAASLPH